MVIVIVLLLVLVSSWDMARGFHMDIYQPRVPPEILEEVQENENPYPPTPERIEAGKNIFFGKGFCVTCHGKNG